MENEWLYRLALTRVRGIGACRAKILVGHFGEAAAIFRAGSRMFENIPGIGTARARAIREFRDFHAVEKEMAFLERYKITPLFFTDAGYPRRLAKYKNAPALLFYKGAADLNAGRILSVVGTRNPDEYGRQATELALQELAHPDLLIVSGLAYGIDVTAHKAALRNRLPTIGVLGHGLDRIYPEQHTALAREMLMQGGLLTEFSSGTEPDEHNFPIRNRIVAAMSDALLVIETGCRGGSMLTVENAISYGKKVFALPGRITDNKSAGCHALIRQGKAILFAGAQYLLQEMGWGEQTKEAVPARRIRSRPTLSKPALSQPTSPETAGARSDFSEPATPEHALSQNEKILLDLLRQAGGLYLDELLARDDLGGNGVSLTLLTLELQGLIRCLPGKRYVAV